MQEEPIFQNKEIRNLFKTKNLIGENFQGENFRELAKLPALKKIFCNQSINKSVDVFFEGGMNLSKASAKSYIHRNTLIYRIGKIKKTIGLDLKKFEDCIIYMNAREIFKIINLCQNCETCKNCK